MRVTISAEEIKCAEWVGISGMCAWAGSLYIIFYDLPGGTYLTRVNLKRWICTEVECVLGGRGLRLGYVFAVEDLRGSGTAFGVFH